jgi:tetrahydromethanopterin S-methyltransferase subunit F
VSPIGRNHQLTSGASVNPIGRNHQLTSGASVNPIGRNHQLTSGASVNPIGRNHQLTSGASVNPIGRNHQLTSRANVSPIGLRTAERFYEVCERPPVGFVGPPPVSGGECAADSAGVTLPLSEGESRAAAGGRSQTPFKSFRYTKQLDRAKPLTR